MKHLNLATISLTIAGIAAGVVAQNASFTNTDLIGSWQSKGCEQVTFNNQTNTMKRQFEFTATRWQLKFTLFADPNCTVPLITTRLSGPYELGAAVQLPSTRQITWGQTAKFVTPHASPILGALNDNKCGDVRLALDAERDVSQTGCLVFGIGNVKDYPQEYDLLKLENRQLFTGLRNPDMNLERNRPTRIFEFPLVRP